MFTFMVAVVGAFKKKLTSFETVNIVFSEEQCYDLCRSYNASYLFDASSMLCVVRATELRWARSGYIACDDGAVS